MKQKDFCTDELNTNQLQTEGNQHEKQDIVSLVEDLTNAIQTLISHIDKLKLEISQLQVQLKRASEDRQAQNKEFQIVVQDQHATQKLLQKALLALQWFYDKKAGAFVQRQQEHAGNPPPPGFMAYKGNAASHGVIGMIERIIEDAKAMEAEAIQ